MPLTIKGRRILQKMSSTYKGMKKAKQVFYAMIAEGKLKGVEAKKKKKTKSK